MPRWRVDYLGKKATHLGTVEAPDEKAAIAEAGQAVQHQARPTQQNPGDEDRKAAACIAM